jgi:hypothetical protein
MLNLLCSVAERGAGSSFKCGSHNRTVYSKSLAWLPMGMKVVCCCVATTTCACAKGARAATQGWFGVKVVSSMYGHEWVGLGWCFCEWLACEGC